MIQFNMMHLGLLWSHDNVIKFDLYCQLSGSKSNSLNLWKLPGHFSYSLGTRLKDTQRPTGKDVSNTWANAIAGDEETDARTVLQLPVAIRIIISIPPGPSLVPTPGFTEGLGTRLTWTI